MKRSLLALFVVLASASLAVAQTSRPSVPVAQSPAKIAEEPTKTGAVEAKSPLVISAGVDWQSKYIFRGFTTTENGLIVQPYAQVGYTVYDKNDLTVTPYIGTWENITSHPYAVKNGHTNNWRWLSETDIDLGVTTTYKNFTFGLNYIYYLYPNGSLGEDQEAGVTVAYDDSGIWKDSSVSQVFSAVNPHAAYYHELRNLGGPEGGYLELGVEPTAQPVKIAGVPVTFSVPVTLGLSTDRYYSNSNGSTQGFGYLEAGAKASVPLGHAVGDWTLVGEVDYWHLNASNIRQLDNGKSNDWTARLGVSVKF